MNLDGYTKFVKTVGLRIHVLGGFLAALSLGMLASAHANPIRVQAGDYVCVVQNSSTFSLFYSIARSSQKEVASTRALQDCLEGALFENHCMRPTCESDLLNPRGSRAKRTIKSTANRVSIEYEGLQSPIEAVARNKNSKLKRDFVAKAPTLIEAKALALNLCTYEATFKNHCELVSLSE